MQTPKMPRLSFEAYEKWAIRGGYAERDLPQGYKWSHFVRAHTWGMMKVMQGYTAYHHLSTPQDATYRRYLREGGVLRQEARVSAPQ